MLNFFCFTFSNFDALIAQKNTKLQNLLLEFTNKLRIGVLVDNGFTDNLLRAVSISGWEEKYSN